MGKYTPDECDLVRGFRTPRHSKPPQSEGESFAEYLGRLSIESHEIQIADESAARRGIAKVKADAWAEGHEAGYGDAKQGAYDLATNPHKEDK